jgi:hypothetical protein
MSYGLRRDVTDGPGRIEHTDRGSAFFFRLLVGMIFGHQVGGFDRLSVVGLSAHFQSQANGFLLGNSDAEPSHEAYRCSLEPGRAVEFLLHHHTSPPGQIIRRKVGAPAIRH